MRIIIPNPFLEAPLNRLRKAHSVHYDPALFNHPEALIELVRDADALIVRNVLQVRGHLLDAMVRCRVIGRLGVGLDNIDTAVCKARGITVIPAIGANARSVAEYVIASAMMLRRGAYLSTSDVAAGKWPKHEMAQGRELYGATLGIVGFGSIGQTVAGLAQQVGMRVIACPGTGGGQQLDPARQPVTFMSMDALLAQSDVVTLHVPYTDNTRGMLDRSAIAGMKAGSILVNTARGGIVDERAVVDAVRDGTLGGAALDVFSDEPLGPDNCFANAPPNLILTPHIAGVTQDSEERVCELIADKVMDALALRE